MNFFYIFGIFSCFLLAFHTEIVHSKSILEVAISSKADKISLQSPDANKTIQITRKISPETTIRIIRKGSKQDDDEDATSRPGTNVGTPIQTVVNSVIFPGVEYAAASILKAVSSPFEFLTKSVSDYVNPTTSTAKPAKKVVETNVASSSDNQPQSQQSQVTYLVISPDQAGSGSSPNVASPAPTSSTQQTTVSREEEEEDEEENEDENLF